MREEILNKLQKAFALLRERGYAAYPDPKATDPEARRIKKGFWCCQSCGCAALPEGTTNYVFYHQQDAEGLKEALDLLERNRYSSRYGYDKDKAHERVGLHLAWGGDGNEIRRCLMEAGLAVTWDGKEETRIWASLPHTEPVLTPDQEYHEQFKAFLATLH